MGPWGRETLLIPLAVVRPRTFSTLSSPCPPVQSRAREKRVERALNLAAGALKIQGSGPLGLLFISFSQSLEILGWARGCAGIGRGHVFPTVSEMVAVLFLPLKLSTQSVHRDHILPLSLRDSGKMALRKRFFFPQSH